MTDETTEDVDAKIEELHKQRFALRDELFELRKQRPPESVTDAVFQDHAGNPVRLSELFGEGRDLILVHNMGARCPMCTTWADGFNGIAPHIENRAPFVVVSPDAPDVQRAFYESRGWRFRMVSSHGTSFFEDMGFATEQMPALPGVSVFHKADDGSLTRVARDWFGPHDPYCALFPLMDLLPDGQNEVWPKLSYDL